MKSFHVLILFAATMILGGVAYADEEIPQVFAQHPASSPSGKSVVFEADFDSPASNMHLWIAGIDGSGLRKLPTSSISDQEPSWSPDGTQIAFSSMNGRASDIWIIRADGTNLRQLTSNALNNRQPVWSPDGSKIAFVSDRGGTNDIWIMNADGTGQTRLTTLPGEEDHPSFSPRGDQIVFSETAGKKANLMIIGSNGTGLRTLTNGTFKDWNPSWGPNGIVFSSNRDTSSEHWKIWTIFSDGSGLAKVGDTIGLDPVPLPDGMIIFGDEINGTGALSAISVLDPKSGKKRVVVDVRGFKANIAFKPDATSKLVNPWSHATVLVAMLSTKDFDATSQVDQSTITFGHTGNENSLYSCQNQPRDVNGDGLPDLVCQFKIEKSGIQMGDTSVTLRFKNLDGTSYEGRDTIITSTQSD
jgi:Tol biopolymer transport system component